MSLPSASPAVRPQSIPLTPAQYDGILAATNAGRPVDAWNLAQQVGPLEGWAGPDAMALAARLAGHLGGGERSWRLAQSAVRAYPDNAKVRIQHFYGVLERRGHFSALHYLPKIERCPTDVPLEKAEVLITRSDVHLGFRDFSVAGACMAEAQKLAPESPWVWTAGAGYWQAQNQAEQALPYLDHALVLQPWFRPAVQMRAVLLQSLGRDDETLAFLQEACRHLQHGGVFNQLATIYSERENWTAFWDTLQELRTRWPLAEEGAQAWLAMRETDALIGLGDFPRAAEKAAVAGEKVKWYAKLSERLRGVTAPGRRVKIDVPYIRQDYNTCAPATLSAVTTFWQRPIAQETLINEICYDGTTAVAERRWIEANGWFCREFKVTWDITTKLLDLGLPFILSTYEVDSGHAQCLIGYDTVRGTLLIRDPNMRHHAEMSYEEFAKHYDPVGPRGVLVLPPEKAALVEGIEFPETAQYDLIYELASALDGYDRPRADAALARLAETAPNSRHYWMAVRALAGYDQNPVQSLEAVDHLRALYPDDDRLVHARVSLLRHLGRNDEARATLRERQAKKGATTALWNDYAEEQRISHVGMNCSLRLAWRRLRHQPHNIGALARFAATLWENQRKEESLEKQRLAVSISDKNEHTAGTYFRMLLGLGRAEEGIDFLRRRAQRLLPLAGDPTLTLAEALHQLHRTQEARETLAAAIPQQPKEGTLMLYAAELEAVAMQQQRSTELLQAAAPHTNRLIWLRAAARLQRRAGEQEQALASWRELAQTAMLDLEAHREIALLLARRDGRPAGVAYLQEIGRRFPQHIGLLQIELAWLQGHNDEELEQRLGGYLAANPYNAWAQREYVLFQERTRPAAIDETVLQRAQFARQLDPNNPVSWLIEASVLRSLGRIEEARKDIRRALEMWIDNGHAQQQLLFLCEHEDDKKESLTFILQQLVRQKAAGAGIIAYREVAFPVLPMDELTTQLRDFHRYRPEFWETSKALLSQLIATGHLDEAQEVAVAATQRFPLLAETWQQLGTILMHKGDRPRAIEFFRFVLELEPERVPVIHQLAGACRDENRPAEALALLEEAQRRNPLNASLAGAYAENLWRLDRRDEALVAVRRSVELDPDYQWGWDALSSWSRIVTGHDEAFDLCRACAEKMPNDAAAWTRVARRATGPGQGTIQLDAAQRARAADPHNADVHDTLVVALVRQHRVTEALQACWPPEFSGRNPFNLRGREAWIFLQQGEVDKAITQLNDILESNPQYAWGWDVLIDCHLRKKDLNAALAGCERLVRLNPLVASGYLRRADIEVQLKKSTEAKRDLQRAFALSPMPAAAWQLLRLQLEAHEYDAAVETLRQMQPHIAPAIMLPARMLVAARRNQVDEALNLFAQMALLPEVDANAVNQAIQALDLLKRGDLLNARLGTVMKEPKLNPFFAAVWVARRGAFFHWKLLGQYQKLTPDVKVRSAYLCEWMRQVRRMTITKETANLVAQTAKTIATDCADISRADTQVWANLGNLYINQKNYAAAKTWLSDWQSRTGVEGWMVTNLVYALHGLNQQAEADQLSREILNRGLRDHSTSVHLCYLAISALEAGQTAEARAYNDDIEPQNLRPEQAYIQSLVHAALLVQEAATPEEMAAVFAAQQPRLGDKRPKDKPVLPAMTQAQEKRCLAVMARDAGKPVPQAPRNEASKNRLPRPEPPPNGPPPPPAPLPPAPPPARRPFFSFGRGPFGMLRLALIAVVLLSSVLRMAGTGHPGTAPYTPPAAPDLFPTTPSAASPSGATTASLIPTLPGAAPTQITSISPGFSAANQAKLASSSLETGVPLKEVVQEMKVVLASAPQDPQVLTTASEFELRMHNPTDAANLAQRATLASPENARALGDYGLALVMMNRTAEARASIDRSLEIDPHNSPGLTAKSVVAIESKDADQAIDLINQAIEADPNNRVAWTLLNTMYEAAMRVPAGEARLRELVQRYPDSEPAWYALSISLYHQKKYPESLDAINHAKSLDPYDCFLWNSLGLLYANTGDGDKALDAFHQSLQLDSVYDEAWNNQGYTLLQQGKTLDAIDSFQQTLKINPHHSRALVNLTNAYIKTGQLADARKTCDMLATINPQLADSIRPNIH